MALSPPPQRTKQKAPTEEQVETFINGGGQPAPKPASQAAEVDPDTIRHVNTRLTEGIIRQIDELRAKRPRKMGSPKLGVSLRDWIVEAVMEKLQRDSKKK